MACYHPMKARRQTSEEQAISVRLGRSPKQLIFSKGQHLLDTMKDGILDHQTGEICEWFDVRCDKCIGCRLDYSRDWANRNCLEALCYDEDVNKFLTFTYDDDHVPISDQATLTTRLDDVSEFNKRLRRHYEYHYNHQGIRFYASSEYGSKTFRPHYHSSFFNLPIPDLKQIATNFQGDPLYTSELINRIWGKGYVVIGDFAWNTAAYTARYIVKKLKGPIAALEYQAFGLEPESTRSSRRPGIGIEWINHHEDWMDIYEHDQIVLPSNGCQVNAIKPPRIFDKKLEQIDPARLARIKSKRAEVAQLKQEEKLKYYPSKEEYFRIEETAKIRSNEKLLRVFQDLT